MDQFELNRHIYGDGQVVRLYSEPDDPLLFPAEVAILRKYDQQIRGSSILDVGVGGGRTTPHLVSLASRYVGVDYSEQLVAECHKKYPGIAFAECDARTLDAMGNGTFDAVLFSFNGIDHVNHSDRQLVLSQVYRKLNPGGLFWFSSHNLRVPARKPWALSCYRWRQRPAGILQNLFDIVRDTRNYWQRAKTQAAGEGYAILVDEAHDFRLVLYYVDPAAQVNQLRAHGFREVTVFDFDGVEHTAESPEIDRSVHVHYVAIKPH
jgi:SAM-dependent methyltransferase